MRTRIFGIVLFAFLSVALFVSVRGSSDSELVRVLESVESGVGESGNPVEAEAEIEQRESDERPEISGFYGAPEGTVRSFEFEHATSYRLEIDPGADDQVLDASGETVSLPFAGTLHMQVVQRKDEVITVLVQGEGVEAKVARPDDPRGVASLQACCEALTNWFLVRIDTKGRIRGYAFQQQRTAEQRNFARAVIASFFHTIPVVPTATWEAEESDATGDFTADYRLLASDTESTQIERTKRSYSKIGKEEQLPEHVLGGRSRATFLAGGGWIDAVDVDESVAMGLAGMPGRVHLAVAASFRRITSSWRGVDLERADWPGFVSASGAGENLTEGAQQNEREKWRQKTAKVSLDELLETIRALVAAGDTRGEKFYAAWEMLHWKLALDPETVAAVQEMLQNGALDEGTGSMVLSALGKAGTPEAQGALLSVYDSTMGEGWRESAALSMFQVTKPTKETLQSVTDRLADLRSIDRIDAASMLLLGTIAPRSDAELASGASAFSALVGLEGRVKDLGMTGLWLDALGNSSVPAVAQHASRYLRDDKPLVREAAVGALDRSNAKNVVPQLIVVAEKDASRDVRIRAIEALGKRGAKSARASLRRMAVQDKDLDVRRAALNAVAGSRRLDASDRQMLERVAARDANAELRAEAKRILQGMKR